MAKAATENSPGKYKFILFISGMSAKSILAVENINKITTEHLKGNFDLEIIDVSKEREQAVHYQIIGLPTLIKVEPKPARILLGDLSDTEKVLRILDIR